jgi:hypothetical protein
VQPILHQTLHLDKVPIHTFLVSRRGGVNLKRRPLKRRLIEKSHKSIMLNHTPTKCGSFIYFVVQPAPTLYGENALKTQV